METLAPDPSPQEQFRAAKVEHYLERAEELLSEARYDCARLSLERAMALDPSNALGKSLFEEIDRRIDSLKNRRNGQQESGHQGANGDHRRSKRLVLIVDQDEVLLQSLALTFQHSGFDVIGAGNIEEALQVLPTYQPDVVVSEINFEDGPRGLDLFREVRTSPRGGSAPFIFMGARVDNDLLIAGKRLGVDDLLLKPVNNDVIVASVTSCLARARMNHLA